MVNWWDTFQCIQKSYLLFTSDWAAYAIIMLLWEGCQSSAQRAYYLPSLSRNPFVYLGQEEQVRVPCSRTKHASYTGSNWVSWPFDHGSEALPLSYACLWIKLRRKKNVIERKPSMSLHIQSQLAIHNRYFSKKQKQNKTSEGESVKYSGGKNKWVTMQPIQKACNNPSIFTLWKCNIRP